MQDTSGFKKCFNANYHANDPYSLNVCLILDAKRTELFKSWQIIR